MNGTIGFWIRIVLLALSGGAAAGGVVGIFTYDPVTDTITIPVEGLASVIATVGAGAGGFLGWAGLHRKAKSSGGVT